MSPTLEIGLSGVGFDESIVSYVRRCCERAEQAMEQLLQWRVDVKRGANSCEVEVLVDAGLSDGQRVTTSARDQDEMIAIRNAFAAFEERAGTAPPPEVVCPEHAHAFPTQIFVSSIGGE